MKMQVASGSAKVAKSNRERIIGHENGSGETELNIVSLSQAGDKGLGRADVNRDTSGRSLWGFPHPTWFPSLFVARLV